VTNALACNSIVEVTDSRPSFGDISEINLSNLYNSTQSRLEHDDRPRVVPLQEL